MMHFINEKVVVRVSCSRMPSHRLWTLGMERSTYWLGVRHPENYSNLSIHKRLVPLKCMK